MNLVSMYGRPRLGAPQYQFSLFSMSGEAEKKALENDEIANVDPRTLSDKDAGLQALYILAKIYPGLTWGDLLNYKQRLGGNWLTDAGNWVAKTTSNAGDKIGEWGGSALRLLTDQEVADGIDHYVSTATGGSEMDKFLQSLGLTSKKSVDKAGIGDGYFGDFGDITPTTLMVGGGLLLGIILLLK